MEIRPSALDGGSGSPSSGQGQRAVPPVQSRRAGAQNGDIRLTLPARAENVVVVRHVVAALAESLAFPTKLIEDIKLAVTEACTNVVRHAYIGSEGPLEVEVVPGPGELTVTVVDHGSGIREGPRRDGAGLGLPLIAALEQARDRATRRRRQPPVHVVLRSGRYAPDRVSDSPSTTDG